MYHFIGKRANRLGVIICGNRDECQCFLPPYNVKFLAKLKNTSVLFCATLCAVRTTDKGKPAERQRRKAMGLPLCMHDHDRQAAEIHHRMILSIGGPGIAQVRFIIL
jgi:hypothetical protein